MGKTGQSFIEQARRKQIIEAAVDVLADEGFRAATVERIARQAEVSKSLILYHFSSKDELLRQTLFETVAQLASQVTAGISFDCSAVEVLRQLVRQSALSGLKNGRQRRAVYQIVVNLGPGATKPTLGVADAEPVLAGYERLFSQGKEEGVFRADLDTRVMAVTYDAAINAMNRHFDAYPDDDVDTYVTELVRILLLGVQGKSE